MFTNIFIVILKRLNGAFEVRIMERKDGYRPVDFYSAEQQELDNLCDIIYFDTPEKAEKRGFYQNRLRRRPPRAQSESGSGSGGNAGDSSAAGGALSAVIGIAKLVAVDTLSASGAYVKIKEILQKRMALMPDKARLQKRKEAANLVRFLYYSLHALI